MQMDPSRPDGQFKKTVSNGKLRRLWPNFEFTPFSEGQLQFFITLIDF